MADASSRTPTDFYWSVIFVVVFFAIHVGRLDAEWTWLGMLTPAAATLGDIVAALVLSVVVLYPLSRSWHALDAPGRARGVAPHARRHVTRGAPAVERTRAALVGRAAPAAAAWRAISRTTRCQARCGR